MEKLKKIGELPHKKILWNKTFKNKSGLWKAWPWCFDPKKAYDKESNYKFTDSDGGEFTISGSEIIDKGLKLTVTEKRKAKIYLYQTV